MFRHSLTPLSHTLTFALWPMMSPCRGGVRRDSVEQLATSSACSEALYGDLGSMRLPCSGNGISRKPASVVAEKMAASTVNRHASHPSGSSSCLATRLRERFYNDELDDRRTN